jgi:nitrite reductase/ring-hydroxylating ferredoxin subunit
MTDRARLASVETGADEGSWLCTVQDEYGVEEEIVLVPCDGSVEAWLNRCTHEAQRLDTGRGAAIRDGEIICPKHGSMFDICTGYCDNGEAADTTLVSIELEVEDGVAYLVDDDYEYVHDGGIDDGGPSSTSHIGF